MLKSTLFSHFILESFAQEKFLCYIAKNTPHASLRIHGVTGSIPNVSPL